jgi:hypothetical protein
MEFNDVRFSEFSGWLAPLEKIMSTTAYWKPIVPKKGKCLSDTIKRQIARRYMDHDGSLSGSVILDSTHNDWLQGLLDAGVDDAGILLDAIAKHSEIEVWLEC